VPAAPGVTSDPGSIAFLVQEGFVGFRTVGQLHANGCEEVPSVRGIFAVVRQSLDPPRFLPRSPAARFRSSGCGSRVRRCCASATRSARACGRSCGNG
jgi:hypothetical protein